MKYLLIDAANTFFRARHAAFRAADNWEKVGYALHITLSSVNRVVRRFGADHVIFALEGRSWRKDFYRPYKANRSQTRAALTPAQQQEEELFWNTFDSLTAYLNEHTNCSVIRDPQAEADDIIARFIALHPGDQHTVISSDSDFAQLIADNVSQYNGITDELSTTQGIFDAKNKPVIDRKTKLPKSVPDPEWLLFEKCMRGDASDNVFSAYPGVREKGTKNRVGLREAFADRKQKGFYWNNLMLQHWTDHDGNEQRVLDCYDRNRILIDLSAQPQHIKDSVDQAIGAQISRKDLGQIGMRFLKFCGKYELNKIAESSEQYLGWLKKHYQGALIS